MGHRLLDCFGLLALVLYILGALSFYPLLLFGPHAHTDVAFELLLLLPPIFAGAGAHEFLRRRGKARFAPRRLAVDALGAGSVAAVAWKLLLHTIRRDPPAYMTGADRGSEVFWPFLLYLPLCALLSLAATVALPMLVWVMVRRMAPDPIPDP